MKSKSLWTMTLLLLAFWLTATRWLNKPFIGHHDWDNVLLSTTVLNYQAHGYLDHHGLQQRNPAWVPLQEIYFYRSTPPTFAILLSLAVRVFSFDELTLRIPNILLSLISISVFYQFARQLYGKTAGLWGAFFFASAPFIIYFSSIANWEVGNTLIAVSILLLYLRWQRRPQRRLVIWMALLAFVGVWYFYYMPVLLAMCFVHSLIMGDKRQRQVMFGVGVVGLIALVTWLFYTTDGFNRQVIQETSDHLRFRSSSAGDIGAEGFSPLDYLGLFGLRLGYGISPFLIALSLAGVYFGSRQQNALVAVLFLTALIHTTIWRNATYIHDFFMYSFTPAFAAWAGYGAAALWRNNKSWLPQTRPQRLMGGAVFGHILLIAAVIRFFAVFSNDTILWVADHIAERTTITDRIATNLNNGGPHTEFYAHRSISFDIPYSPDILDLQTGYDFYYLCLAEDEPLPEWGAGMQIEEVKPCYAITRPNNSP